MARKPKAYTPIASYLRLAGYTKIPNQRRYIAPSGEVVSRRQAEQRSGALRAIFGESTRERITRYIRPSNRVTKEEAAIDYKQTWKRSDSVNKIMRQDVFFRHNWNQWRKGTPAQRVRAGEQFGWFQRTRGGKWRYVRYED